MGNNYDEKEKKHTCEIDKLKMKIKTETGTQMRARCKGN